MKGVQLATIVVALLHVTTADISHMPAQQGIQEIQQAEVNVKGKLLQWIIRDFEKKYLFWAKTIFYQSYLIFTLINV